MKKFEVYFFSNEKGEKDRETIKAESHEEAFQKYLVGKSANNFKVIVVDIAGFFESMTTSEQRFNNPLYINDEISKNQDDKKPGDLEYNISDSFYSTSSMTKVCSDRLDRLIELQEKQLYWTRIIAAPVFLAIVIFFLNMVFGVFK